MKRLLLGICALALLGGCKKKQAAHTIGLTLDVGGRGDQSFNDGALRGLEVMAAGLRYTAHGYEPMPDAEYASSLPPDLRGQPFPHLKMPPPLVLSGKAQEDYEPNLQLLVDQGARIDAQDAKGQTPYRIAEGHVGAGATVDRALPAAAGSAAACRARSGVGRAARRLGKSTNFPFFLPIFS